MSVRMSTLLSLVQLSDSMLPVGTFSFSNGLETAAHTGLVHDASTLEQFARAAGRQAAFTDGVAALHAYRAARAADYGGVVRADRELTLCKLNDEARQMLTRMGRKLAELGVKLFGEVPEPDAGLGALDLLNRWHADIQAACTPGNYPVAQALVFVLAGMDERALFASHQYGAVNMVLSAALRCVRVSHFDTQIILRRLMAEAEGLYDEAAAIPLEGMHAFAPELDVMAGLHEKGNMRMFMN